MLRYSSSAQEIKPLFYRYYNDIDVYVEDTSDEAFYERLLEKIVDDSIRIRKVFAVGGKTKLLGKVNEYIVKPPSRKMIFIADGDFDKILNRKFPDTKLLYVLKEYCIENFLFEEKAIYNVIQEESPGKKIGQIKAQIRVNKWLEETIDRLAPLFACFIIVQKENIGIPNVKIGVSGFLSNAGIPKLDMNKVQTYMDKVKTIYETSWEKDFDIEIEKITKRMGRSWRTRKKYICGKEYLLPLLRFEIKTHFKRDLKLKTLRFRIMNHCRLESLSELGNRIEAICLSWGSCQERLKAV